MSDETIQLHTLLHRRTDMSAEWNVAVETSLYVSNVTGCYVLEQVQHGRHGTLTDRVSLTPAMVEDFLPLLETISRQGEPDMPGP